MGYPVTAMTLRSYGWIGRLDMIEILEGGEEAVEFHDLEDGSQGSEYEQASTSLTRSPGQSMKAEKREVFFSSKYSHPLLFSNGFGPHPLRWNKSLKAILFDFNI